MSAAGSMLALQQRSTEGSSLISTFIKRLLNSPECLAVPEWEPQTLRCLCQWQNLLGYSLYMKISTALVIMSWSEIQQCHLLLWQEKLVVGNVTDKTWRGETVCQIFASNWLSTVEVPWKCPLLGTRSERVLCKGWMLVGKFVGLGLIILCKRWNGNKIFLKF